MKILIRRKFPIVRVSLGALTFVAGLLVSANVSELPGFLLILLGISLGLPRSPVFALQVAFLVLYFFAIVACMYWFESGEFGPSFADWLSDKWLSLALMSVACFGPFMMQHQQNTDAWRILQEEYSSSLESVGASDSYPAAAGNLIVDTEHFDGTVVATELGIFITREDGGHVYLPWDRLAHLVFEGSKPRRAKAHISRNLMNPLVLNLPWHEHMMRQIPKSLKVETFG